MAPRVAAVPRRRNEYDEACTVWQLALESYLRLARAGAGAAELRAAATAVHVAAKHRGRLAREPDPPTR
jgi:hypothetical protein